MRALITGSSGFVGRHFARHLSAAGWKTDGIDTRFGLWTGSQVDARDFFRGMYPQLAYDLVIHAAAVVGGRHVIENSPLRQAVNLELDAALFSWARVVRPARIVYFSSSAVYPVALQKADLQHTLDEDDVSPHDGAVIMPDELYGWAKLTGEYLARLAIADGLAVTVVRPFSGYGPDQDETYPFAAFAGRAARREDPFLVWGDGRQVRDFVHVDDIVAAVMTMCEREISGPLNIGLGRPVSMTQLASMFCRQAGYEPEFEAMPSAPSGVPWRVAGIARLAAVRLPRISLEDGIAQALEAHGKQETA